MLTAFWQEWGSTIEWGFAAVDGGFLKPSI